MTHRSKPSLSEFFIEHQNDLLQFLISKVNCPTIAADLTQETYLRIAGRSQLLHIENLRAYLFSVANHLAIDYLRGRSRQLQRDGGAPSENLINPAPEPERILADQQQIEFLQQAIYSLPPKCREVFLLCRVDEKSYAEVAEELGISTRTVESHLRRAMEHIRKQFS